MKKLLIHLSFLLLFFNCSSSPIEVKGTVEDGYGIKKPGILVRLVVLSDTGVEQSELNQKLTTSSGTFSFTLPGDLSSSVVVTADLPGGAWRGFAAGDGKKLVIDPISEAIVQAVLNITVPPGGRGLDDFSTSEIRTIVSAARTGYDPTGQDLSDSTTLLTNIIVAAGRTIPDSAGGTLSGLPLADVVGPDVISAAPAFSTTVNCPSIGNTLLTGKYFKFDIMVSGGICNVEAVVGPIGDAFDGAFALTLTGGETFDGSEGFPGDPDFNNISADPPVSVEDSRELVFGPVTTDSGNLSVTRKVKVYANQDLVRYLEIFKNVSVGSTVTFGFRVNGDLGLLPPRKAIAVSDGSTLFTETSDYGAFETLVPNTKQPLVGWVIQGASTLDPVDQVTIPLDIDGIFLSEWQSLSLSPGETKVFSHYVIVSPSLSETDAKTELEAIHTTPDMTGFSATEINNLINFSPTLGNISGEAGSVVSGELLTLTNGLSSVSTQANVDGSFKSALTAVSGDSISIVGNRGTDTSVTVP